MNPFVPSGHAFVCLDSVESAVACIEYFKAGPKEYCNYLTDTCNDKCCCCFTRSNQTRNRSKSTFTRFEDLTEQSLAEVYKDSILVMSRAVEPSELLWKNMKGERGLFIFRRSFLFLIGLCVIVFGTTPTVIVQNIDFLHIFNLQDQPASDLLSHYLQPLVVIMIN